jgi:flagellin-like hook-associated protein FlgL
MTSPLTFNRPQLVTLSRRLGDHTRTLSTTFERLSSGQRIVRPSDDAAGLAIASDLKLDTRVFTQAIRNGNDAISSLSIADGALGELDTVLGRLSELATQSANGAYTLTQRRALDTEANQLVEEYNRIVASTSFNGQTLLSGGQSPTSIQLGYGTDGSIAFTLAQELDTGAGTGTFGSDVVSGSGASGFLRSVDLNADGRDDLVGSTYGVGSISVSLAAGNGTFTETTLSFGAVPTGLATGDLDGDGDIDLAVTDSSTLNIYSNNGAGGFTLQSSLSGGGTNMQAADIDGDTRTDLIFSSGSNIRLMRGNGDGTFNAASTIGTLGSTISSMAVGDFNGDGKPDVVTSSFANTTVTTFLNGGGTLASAGTVTAAAAAAQFRVGDINHDGYDDFLGIVSSIIYASLSRSDGLSSTGLTSLGFSSSGSNAQLSDITGDGYLDIVTKHTTTIIRTYAGTGTGSFSASLGATTINNGTTVVGDFNGDGARDLYSVGSFGSDTYNTYLANTTPTSTIGRLYLLDREGATNAINTVTSVRDRLTRERGAVGANLSRIGTALSNLSANRLNTETAAQRITDADVATESANLVRASIAQNASQALFAQANQNSNILLTLLRN